MSPQPSAFFGGFRRIFWSRLRFGPPDDDTESNPPGHMPLWLPHNVNTVDVWPDAFLQHAVPLDKAKALRLVKLEHFKLPRNHDIGRHELIVAWLCDTLEHKEGRPADDGGYILLRVERVSDAKDRRSGMAGAVSGSDQGCRDQIRFPTLADYEQRVKARYELVRVIDFPNGNEPNVVDLAAILETVSKAGPKYNLYSTMCIWFAGTAFDVVCKLFAYAAKPEETGVARAGMIGSFPVYKPQQVQVDEDAAVRAERMLEQERAGGAKAPLTWDDKQEHFVRRSIQNLPPFRQITEDSKKRIEELEKDLNRIDEERRAQEEKALEKARQEGREQEQRGFQQAVQQWEEERDALRARVAQLELKNGGR